MEDIIEEIFGEIQDEYDEGEEELFTKVRQDEYLFDGRIPLDDINEIMGINLPTDETDTLGGLIFTLIGRVPTNGESLTESGVTLTVEELIERRVHKVRAKINPEGDDTSPSSEEK